MSDIIKQLETRTALLQEKIEGQKKLEGAKEQLLSQLKELGVGSIDEAKATVVELDAELLEVTNEITTTIQRMDKIIAGTSVSQPTST